MRARHVLILVALSAIGLAGCSGSSGLTTGSIFGGKSSAPSGANAPPPEDPMARAMLAGRTAARAQKCGFNFDAGRHRQAFLGAESVRGYSGDMLARSEKTYDQTRVLTVAQIKDNEDYCSAGAVEDIRRDLTRNMAGDFVPARVAAAEGGFWGALAGDGVEKDWDKSRIYNPNKTGR